MLNALIIAGVLATAVQSQPNVGRVIGRVVGPPKELHAGRVDISESGVLSEAELAELGWREIDRSPGAPRAGSPQNRFKGRRFALVSSFSWGEPNVVRWDYAAGVLRLVVEPAFGFPVGLHMVPPKPRPGPTPGRMVADTVRRSVAVWALAAPKPAGQTYNAEFRLSESGAAELAAAARLRIEGELVRDRKDGVLDCTTDPPSPPPLKAAPDFIVTECFVNVVIDRLRIDDIRPGGGVLTEWVREVPPSSLPAGGELG